jgi:isopenicillin N synthase-like dioxygenase
MRWVPLIDLASPDAADEIGNACERVGFFAIVNHGVPADVLHSLWSTARGFFDLPLADKQAVAMPYTGYPYGYAPVAYEALARSVGTTSLPDMKESLAIGPVDAATHPFTDPDEASVWSPNLWPSSLPHLQIAWETAYREFAALAARLLGHMASALKLDQTYFDALIDRHTSAMRALNYPLVNGTATGQQRAGAHTDYGTLTVLFPDPKVGGLEVQRPDGTWASVPPEPGVLVVNLGDAMARWTNDRWRSTLHRVVPAPERRQSIAFFHNANWDAVIECLPTCLNAPAEPARYEPMHAGPHLMAKFRSTVTQSQG